MTQIVLKIPHLPLPLLHRLFPLFTLNVASSLTLPPLSSTAIVSGIIASYVLIQNDDASSSAIAKRTYGYHDLEAAIEKSNEALKRILHRMKQTGVAATMLWMSLRSVLSSANYEVRTGFKLRVASFLADIAAASESRRVAIVGAGGGAIVDWLFETMATASAENSGT